MFNPFRWFWDKALKRALNGLVFVIRRPEMKWAGMVMAGMGFPAAQTIISYITEAENAFPESGSGATKMRWVLANVQRLNNQGVLDIDGLDERALIKHIEALLLVVEHRALLTSITSK